MHKTVQKINQPVCVFFHSFINSICSWSEISCDAASFPAATQHRRMKVWQRRKTRINNNVIISCLLLYARDTDFWYRLCGYTKSLCIFWEFYTFYSKKAEKYQMLMRNVKGLSGILVNNNCWKHEDKFSGII